jgi:hypothetical protein
MGDGPTREGQRANRAGPAVADAGIVRTFPVPGLDRDGGRALLTVEGKAVYAVDVTGDTATLTTGTGGPARVTATFDSLKTLDDIVEGRLHPIVAGLQSRYTRIEGDWRFGLSVLLALRASAPAFAGRRA